MSEKIPSLESKIESIPELNFEQWLKEIKDRINNILLEKERAIISIAGASASGKGEAADFLLQQLKTEGRRPLVISTDDFYKGISKMVVEKLSLDYSNASIDWQTLENTIKVVTGDKAFSDKFSEENLQLIIGYLKENYPAIDANQFAESIKVEFQNIDFDNPDAVDLKALSETLDKIKGDQEVELPSYSMKTSEPGKREKRNPADYDVILVEGIYGLNDEIAPWADIKTFIETDQRTLLMRRFRRDVLAGRSTFPPEIVLWVTLEIVLPAYKKYILPDRQKADLILKKDYTGTETFDTKIYDVQDKIPITELDMKKIAEAFGEPLETAYQKDYYFTNDDETFNPEHLIRIREENGQLKDLIHKGTRIQRDDGKIIRPTETFIKEGEFGAKYKEVGEVIATFRNAGFKLAAEVSKIRKVFKQDNIEITIDQIEGLGDYVEIKTNNKLSLSPEIDKIKKRIGLADRKSVGPYADEYFAKITRNPERAKQQEAMLNQGLTRETILNAHICEVAEKNEQIELAFENLRRGYPERSLKEQCQGKEFRENAEIILQSLAEKTLKAMASDKVVVLMPWRSGLAFAKSYQGHGVNKFYHLSSKRDEETLKTVVDYELGEITPESIVIIADPMLATGNTIIDAIERVVQKGISPENVIINSVVAAPTGVQKIKKLYPEVKIIVGVLDEKLDSRGYIVPGLGDFGDKYFANLSPEELRKIINQLNLDGEGRKKIANRIKKQGASEILSALMERDLKDLEIDELNRKNLIKEGLGIQKPKEILIIDTGRIDGIDSVVGVIKSNLASDVKIISIEGKSGTGKSTTTKELQKTLNGQVFSMGEIFRYLTYCVHQKNEVDFAAIINRLSYKIIDGELKLLDGKLNISDDLSPKLKSKEVESGLPEIASRVQKNVIEFCQKEISKLKEKTKNVILIEGRSFTLDFLPSDLRISLVADPPVRAQRRWGQIFQE